ncbi:hypothetical protein LTR12_018181, partial [Friedmanniomyces endolithicus]
MACDQRGIVALQVSTRSAGEIKVRPQGSERPRKSARLEKIRQNSQTTPPPREKLNPQRTRPQNDDLPRRTRATKRRKQTRLPVVGATGEETSDQGNADNAGKGGNNQDPIAYWNHHGRWPKEYFEGDGNARENLNRNLEAESGFRKYWLPDMNILARKRFLSSINSRSQSASAMPSDQ